MQENEWRVEGLAEYMARAREGRGIQQLPLAQKSGVLQQHISSIKTGKHYIAKDTAEKLAPVLGADADELRLSCVLWRLEAKLDREERVLDYDRTVLRSVAPLARTPAQKKAIARTWARVHHAAYLDSLSCMFGD